ncbi:hypothetical protein ABID08_002729 [Rhizobium binae]|uniref:Uncharacterized protein n=1 Tax=Rhizobium binae TaxID=1138190 RepID=A0ABV2MFW5_9HYPH
MVRNARDALCRVSVLVELGAQISQFNRTALLSMLNVAKSHDNDFIASKSGKAPLA